MKFTVHVMPPPAKQRPPDLRASSTAAQPSSMPPNVASARNWNSLKTLAVPIYPDVTFAELWKEIEKRFRRAFDNDKMAGMYFSHLQDLEGGYITASDTICSMYREDAPAVERQLFMYMEEIDREDAIPVDSDLRPKDFKKRRWADMDDAEQVAKKRRTEEARYSVPIDELGPDTTISPGEAGNEDVLGTRTSPRTQQKQKDPVRLDADGFKIPARPSKLARKSQAETTQSSPIVLVSSSQPEEDDDRSNEPPAPVSADGRSRGDTPPSAQPPPPTQEDNVDYTASPETPLPNAFQILAKGKGTSKSSSGSATKQWPANEDRIILEGIKKGWNSSRILQSLPGGHRTASGVRNRRVLLKRNMAKSAVCSRSESNSAQGSQTLEFASSPPVASGSAGPQSSPCAAAVSTRPLSSRIAYVKLPAASELVENAFLEDSLAEPATEHAQSQTATPSTSNSSETSSLKLRKPAGGPTNASRLRESRNLVKSTMTESRGHELGRLPASDTTVIHGSEESSVYQDRVGSFSATESEALRINTVGSSTTNLSVAPDVEHNPPHFNNNAHVQVEAEANGKPPNANSEGNDPHSTPEVTLPQRKKNSIFHNRTDKQRWREAVEIAKGDKVKAREVFIVNLNKEDMLDAVTVLDRAGIGRLKSQRRRRERELALSKGLSPPKRRVPASFSSMLRSSVDPGDADEEVVRDDDWTTDEEEALNKSRDDGSDEDSRSIASGIYSDDNFEDVEAEFEGPRIFELPDIPPPVAESSKAHAQRSGRQKEVSVPPGVQSSDAGSQSEKSTVRRGKRRRSSHLSDVFSTTNASITSAEATLASHPTLFPRVCPSHKDTGTVARESSLQRNVSQAAKASLQQDGTTKPARSRPTKRDMATTSSSPAPHGTSAGRRKRVFTPRKRLTREEVVAAHLAECKRKEALYLNKDDDDDDDDSCSNSSSSS